MRQQKILPYVVVHNQQTIVGEVIIIKGRNVFNGCGLQRDAGKLVVRRQRHISDLLGNGDGLIVVRDAQNRRAGTVQQYADPNGKRGCFPIRHTRFEHSTARCRC